MVGASGQGYRESLARVAEHYRDAGAEVVVDEFLQARSPNYRDILERALPGSLAQALTDAGTAFEHEVPGLIDWQIDEAEARRIHQPVLSVLGGESETLWPRFGETHRWLLAHLSDVDGCILPGTTHLLQIEDPRGMAEALVAFWSRHPIPASAA
ncbi:MAG TPA: hypothetical protein VFV93_02100 [Thermomicrobiales bacterium]|nr:hypothetical protein [Thermomicrobiales bacterium]